MTSNAGFPSVWCSALRGRHFSNLTQQRVKPRMIEVLKSDEIVNKLGGRFKLTALIQRRLEDLIDGARPLVERRGRTDLEVVIDEIMQDKIAPDWSVTGYEPNPDKR